MERIGWTDRKINAGALTWVGEVRSIITNRNNVKTMRNHWLLSTTWESATSRNNRKNRGRSGRPESS